MDTWGTAPGTRVPAGGPAPGRLARGIGSASGAKDSRAAVPGEHSQAQVWARARAQVGARAATRAGGAGADAGVGDVGADGVRGAERDAVPGAGRDNTARGAGRATRRRREGEGGAPGGKLAGAPGGMQVGTQVGERSGTQSGELSGGRRGTWAGEPRERCWPSSAWCVRALPASQTGVADSKYRVGALRRWLLARLGACRIIPFSLLTPLCPRVSRTRAPRTEPEESSGIRTA